MEINSTSKIGEICAVCKLRRVVICVANVNASESDAESGWDSLHLKVHEHAGGLCTQVVVLAVKA